MVGMSRVIRVEPLEGDGEGLWGRRHVRAGHYDSLRERERVDDLEVCAQRERGQQMSKRMRRVSDRFSPSVLPIPSQISWPCMT